MPISKSPFGEKSKKARVAVAIGGGVASAVTAALLKSEGYEVIAVNFKTASTSSEALCASEKSESRVNAVAEKLGLPLTVIDVAREFENEVLDVFVHKVLEGKRPLPCHACHTRIKIPKLIEFADSHGCTFVATGHIAALNRDPETGSGRLYRAVEKESDQSHLLFDVHSQTLGRILTPMGNFSRVMIEKLAQQFEVLPEGSMRPTLGPCFGQYPECASIIESRSPMMMRPRGTIRTLDGALSGEHNGLYHYAVGQRLYEGSDNKNAAEVYVCGFDMNDQILVVGPEKKLYKDELLCSGTQWLKPVNELKALSCTARIEGHEVNFVAGRVLTFEAGMSKVYLNQAVRGPWVGMPVVFYQDNEVIGGAIVEQALSGSKVE